MIELISNLFKEGDFIKIFLNNSSKSIEGHILKILSDSIALKTDEGKIFGVKGNNIDFFENESSPQPPKDIDTSTSPTTISPEPKEELAENRKGESNLKPIETNVTNASIEQITSNPRKDINQYKPGDVIPYEELLKKDIQL